MKEYLRAKVLDVHNLFIEHPFFGPLLFIVLTTGLMLPPFGGASTDAIKYACLLLGFSFLGFSLRSNLQVSENIWLKTWILLWATWVTFSVVMARDKLFALIGNYPRYNSSWVVYVGFAVLVYAFVSLGRKYVKPLVILLTVCSFFIALFGILQTFGLGYYGGLESLLAVHPDRVPSLVGNPNFSSWYVACVLPFAIFGVINSKKVSSLIIWVLTIFISCWSLVLFASRGAILGAVIGVVVLLIFLALARHFKLVAIISLVGVCAILLFSGYYSVYRTADSVIVSNKTSIDISAYNRFVAWDMARIIWQSHKFTGIGPGNFDQYYWELLPSPLMGGAQYFDDAHNALIVLLVDLGLPGFALFLILFARLGLTVFRRVQKLKSMEWWMAGSAGIAVWLVACIFNPAVVALWVLLALLVAITILACEATQAEQSVTWTIKQTGRIFGVLCIFLAAGLVVGEYTLVYVISIDPYKTQYKEIIPKQYKLTTWARRLEPYNLEIGMANITTKIATGQTSGVDVDIAKVYALHPFSTRSAFIAAQVSFELWQKTKNDKDKEQSEKYLNFALKRSQGYPVVATWAAHYYWQLGNVTQSEKYARWSAGVQGSYFNWLLLAKQYQEKANLRGMIYALKIAQSSFPDNEEMKKMLIQLQEAKDPMAVRIIPGEFPVLTRLH